MDDLTDDFDLEDARKAGLEIGDATDDAAGGLGVDGKDYELSEKSFAGMDGLDAKDLEALREVTPAEIGEIDLDRDLSDAAEKQLEEQAEALEGLSPEDLDAISALYMDILRQKLREVREKTHAKTVAKLRARNDEKIGTIAMILGWLSLSGVLLLLMPLWMGKKYPGQTGRLFGFAALASGTFVLSMLLFTGALLGMRLVQGELAEQTNPQIVIQEATFDAAEEHLEDIAAMPGLLLVPLEEVSTEKQDSLGVAILENAGKFKEDFDALQKVANGLKGVDWLFGYVAPALTLLAVLLFVLNVKVVVVEILRLPDRAMRGEIPAAAVVGGVMKRVGGEIVATLCTLGVLVVLTVVTSVAMTVVAIPAMSLFVGQLLATLQYVFVQPGAEKLYVYVGLGGILAFLVLALVVILAGTAFYIGKTQKIFRAKFCDRVPLGRHKPFFGWRTLGLAWLLALPVGVLVGASHLAEYLVDEGTEGKEFDWFMALVPGPAGLLVGFLALFTVAFGLKALLSIVRYKVDGTSADAGLEQAAQAMPAGR